jgi:hypothetical protein
MDSDSATDQDKAGYKPNRDTDAKHLPQVFW